MRVIIEHEGEVFEFIPKKILCSSCDAKNSAGCGDVCGTFSRDKKDNALCSQLYKHIEGRSGIGHFKKIS